MNPHHLPPPGAASQTRTRAVLTLLGLLIMLASSTQAVPVKKEHAAKAAATFIAKTYPAPDKTKVRTATAVGSSHLAIKQTEPVIEAGQIIGYVAALDPAGYVLLSADDDAPAIKLHSDKGAFEELPPAVRTLLRSELAEDLDTLKTHRRKKAATDPRHKKRWSALVAPETAGGELGGLGPITWISTALLTTTWGQGAPYNGYCPVASLFTGDQALAGCNAIALAQILRYWQQPVAVAADHTYTDSVGPCTGTFSISDAGLGAYHWSAMPAALTASSSLEEKRAVAQLVYHAAVAVDSDFGLSATYGNISSHASALATNFNFDAGGVEMKSSYTSAQWYNKIKADIDAGRPVDYAMWGTDSAGSAVGHSLVCDGHRNGNEIHLNFGWSGASDAWYNLDSVTGTGFNWTSYAGIFGIAPHAIYVNAAYNAGHSDGTLARPFTTVNRAWQAAQKPTVIRIAGGVYRETITINRPMRLEAMNGVPTIGTR